MSAAEQPTVPLAGTAVLDSCVLLCCSSSLVPACNGQDPTVAALECVAGEVTMLSSANSEISLRAAATQARNTQLTVRLDGMGARLAGVEQQIKEREAALAAARIALIEKDSGLCRLEAQAAALEQQLLAAGQAAKKQDIFQG